MECPASQSSLALLLVAWPTVALFATGARLVPDELTNGHDAHGLGGASRSWWNFSCWASSSSTPTRRACCSSSAGTRAPRTRPGLRWANPFYTKKRISQRVRSFESAHLKVNDKEGNPIEIGAVVVWKVVDTAEATFEVDNYENYVRVQSEAALRNAATSYPYDSHDEANVISLRGTTGAVAEHLKEEMQQRLQKAGVEVIETRISHLAYAPEIAAAMLQRQQAGAIIAARTRIVEGAVGMVEMALTSLAHKGIVTLDEERKAAMVSNLLVVLCGERARAADRQRRDDSPVGPGAGARCGGTQDLSPSDRRGGARGRAALGERRSAQPERADRVRPARRAAPCRPGPHSPRRPDTPIDPENAPEPPTGRRNCPGTR